MPLLQRILGALAMSLTLAAPLASANPVLLYDVKAGNAAAEAGWTAVNLSGINGVTFTAVGSLFLDDRDRGGLNTDDAGDLANNDMWRDFIFADERLPQSNTQNPAVTAPAGMDIAIAGLLANTLYSVQLWAFDEISNPTRNTLWNGVAYGFSGTDPDPASLNDHLVRFKVMSDASGVATLKGRVNFADRGPCCNVFVNGFSLEAVPEPGSLALACIGVAAVGTRRVRRRRPALA